MEAGGTPGTLLVLATYGLEIVEVGGTVARHVRAGGRVHATVTLARPEARDAVARAAGMLGTSVEFLDFTLGAVTPDVESKRRLVRVVRQVRPDVVITDVADVKDRALAELHTQHAFTARMLRRRLAPEVWPRWPAWIPARWATPRWAWRCTDRWTGRGTSRTG